MFDFLYVIYSLRANIWRFGSVALWRLVTRKPIRRHHVTGSHTSPLVYRPIHFPDYCVLKNHHDTLILCHFTQI